MSDLLEYKCPACGGAMEFDSALQKMKCPYCDTTIEMQDMLSKDDVLDAPEADISSLQGDSFAWGEGAGGEWENGETDNMSVFTCKSCGGEIVGDQNTGATECPFCGNQVVMTGRFQGALKPDYVIPFKLDKNAAKQKYKEHINGKFLLPKEFKTENHIDEIKGIYVPFWLYDSDISAHARFDAENVRHWSDSKYNYTEVSTYDCLRSGNMSFRNIPVDGSTIMPDDLMESIEPFDFNDAVPFQTAYLAGYFADKYDVDEKQSEARANERVRQSAIETLSATVQGYSSVRSYDSSTFLDKFKKMDNNNDYVDMFAQNSVANNSVQILKGSVKYALYPVYLLTTTYKGEQYTFAMNGQTGKFVGNLPMDKRKKNITFAGIFAGVTAIATGLFYFFMS